MKIFASGEAINLNKPTNGSDYITLGRVVGVVDLGRNNGENNLGWCGLKAVLNVANDLYVLDFPEEAKIETDDGLHIASGDQVWWPCEDELEKYGLYTYKLNREKGVIF